MATREVDDIRVGRGEEPLFEDVLVPPTDPASLHAARFPLTYSLVIVARSELCMQ